MRRSSPASTRGAIRRALPCFGERALPEGDDDGRSSAEMVGSGRERLDQYCCELSRDCNRRPSASGAVSDAAPQMGSGNPGTPVGSSPLIAHRGHSLWAPAPASLVIVRPSQSQPGPSPWRRCCPDHGAETGTDVPPSAPRGTAAGFSTRMRRHIEVQDPTPAQFHDHEYIKDTESAVNTTKKSHATIAWA